MKFTKTPLNSAYLIDVQKREDERGFFSRVFCKNEFEELGLEPNFVQVNNSLSVEKGTLRGLHYQLPPKEEVKVVRCIRGSIFDVIVDIRKNSPTFGKWFGAELSGENRRMMYVPKGFAHGFLSLTPNSELVYFVSEFYSPEHERGVRWDDPSLKIEWPGKPNVISDKDSNFPNLAFAARS
jgi:dTDP-4-dehydrorhamnose 3,5-epimerase